MSWSLPAGAWLRRAGMVALLWLLGGRAGLLLGVVIAVVELWRPLRPRELLAAALLLLVALPLLVLARGLPSRATLSPDFAAGSLLPQVLAGAAVALLVLGVLRDVRAGLPPEPGPSAAVQRSLTPRRPTADPEHGDEPASDNGRTPP